MFYFWFLLLAASIYELVSAEMRDNLIILGLSLCCASASLLFTWRAYLSLGVNRQRAQAWLRSETRSRILFGIVMMILSFAVVGHMIVDIGQQFFGWK
jgi:hypothetical protein